MAVRLRPFNPKLLHEKASIEAGTKPVVEMENTDTVILTSPADGAKTQYTYDYAFWSHDPKDQTRRSPKALFADNQHVFDKVGQQMLERAQRGFNCAIFAYGQVMRGRMVRSPGVLGGRGLLVERIASL